MKSHELYTVLCFSTQTPHSQSSMGLDVAVTARLRSARAGLGTEEEKIGEEGLRLVKRNGNAD